MSINPNLFLTEFLKNDVNFFTGVPDSLLKEFCLCLDSIIDKKHHIITSNEGNAISLASGNYLGSGMVPLVYMQNSGFGNAINPLLSLCDPDVYSIPLIILVGWRGEPGIKDEPQHIKQGRVQIDLLKVLNLDYDIISKNDKNFQEKISTGINKAKTLSRPFVFLIKKGTFLSSGISLNRKNEQKMFREDALKVIIKCLDKDQIVVSTTGKTSREIYEVRENRGESHEKDFLTVGSMGHCSSIALGIALAKPERSIVCIDGDGSMLMHLGSLTNIAVLKPKNFYYILINNEVHESVGGQYTAAKDIDLSSLVSSMGVFKQCKVSLKDEFEQKLKEFFSTSGPVFIEVKIKPGSRKDLGRPKIPPAQNKLDFMKFIKKS